MKLHIVGGGPAGLYLAILMKKRDPARQITIYERSKADLTWGWGVVFSDKTLGYLEGSDQIAHERLQQKLVTWNDVVVMLRGEEVRIHGNPFSSIARIEILKILHERCRELDVDLRFETDVGNPESLRDCDLLVGADGINSIVRTTWQDAFEPDLHVASNKYIWLGTPHLFHGLTMAFTDSEAGPFAAHAYRFNDTTSTFIAECTEATWRKAGLNDASEAQTLAYMARVFERELGGQPVLSNASRWINFIRVKNANWHFDNVVLLGDALHTAHFSIGSGTKLAMEDSITLARCLDAETDVGAALAAFETERRPVVDKLQAAAQKSRTWFENFGDKMDQPPVLFAHDNMTRSGRIDMDRLRDADPAFVNAYEAAAGAS